MTTAAFFSSLAALAVSFEAPVAATVLGTPAFCFVGHGW